MEARRFDFILEAAQPIAHAEENVGNTSVAMRRKVRLPGGGFVRVPCITADTLRHGLREAAAYAYLDAAGLLGSHLSEAALRLLFSGGMVLRAEKPKSSSKTTGTKSRGAVKLEQYREMVDLFPPLALLGGCAQNRVIPGKVIVDDAMLICSEQEHLLPEWVIGWMAEHGGEIESCRGHLEEVQRVRMDPVLDPGKRKLLMADDAAAVETRLLSSEAASETDDHQAKEESKSAMMPRRFERLVAGSLFHWSVSSICHSELDVDTFHVMCGAFLSNARVGGKKGTGHGLLRVVTGRNVHVRRPSELMMDVIESADKLAPRVGALFQAHVRERSDKIREWLASVAA